MFSQRKTALLLLIVLAAVVLNSVKAAYIDPSENNEKDLTSDNENQSSFLSDIGDVIKSSVKKVKEKVETGYDYIKTKVSSPNNKNKDIGETEDPSENGNESRFHRHQNKSTPKPNEDRITFLQNENVDMKDEDLPLSTFYEINETTQKTIYKDEKQKNETILIDRTALDAPNICQKDEVYVDGVCRKKAPF